jgi:hypothetical protein
MKKTIPFFLALAGIFLCFQSKAQIATYCTSNATSTLDSKIDSVVLNTLVSGSPLTTCVTYTDNTHLSTVLTLGDSYTISITNGTCGNYYSNYKRAWIDFDGNGQFDDPAERIIDVTSSSAHQSQSATFIVPATAALGNTFMRVISQETNVPIPCGTYAFGETQDFTIVIASGASNDAGIGKFVVPKAACEGVQDVKVEVSNFGSNQIDSVEIHWSINGVLQAPYAHLTLLDTVSGQGPSTATVTLGSVTLLVNTTDTFKAWTSLPNSVMDTVNFNDTLAKVVTSLPSISTFPYYEDFENGQADWFISGTNSSWAFGTPAKVNIQNAASGMNAFVTGGLSGSYNFSEASQVNSPCFDLTSIQHEAWIALDANWYSENAYDGAVLQSSIDGGSSWQNVGKLDDDNNWYNQGALIGLPGGQSEGWGGIVVDVASGGWLKAAHLLDPSLLRKDVRFRIAFGSDGSVIYEGFAFDNFAIVDYQNMDLGPDRISLCGATQVELDPHVFFNGDIKWSTGDSTSEKITVQTEDTIWVNYTDTMLGLFSTDTVIIIQSTPPAIGFTSFRDTISLQGQITLDPHTDFGLNYDWQPGGHPYPYLLVRGADLGVGTHNITLTVTDSVLCQDKETVVIVVIDITGIEDREAAQLSYYPNPVSDLLTVQLTGFGNETTSIRVIDMQGKVLIEQVNTGSNNQPLHLDVSQLAKGFYFLSVQGDNKSALAKIIVN